MLIMLASNGSIHREAWGVFAPDYKILAETYKEIQDTLDPIIVSASEMKGVIRLVGGGRIDFWTLNNPRAGRSRKYHGVLIDEGAFAGPDMMSIWEKAIKPSLLDYIGEAWVFSTPNGKDDDQFFYRVCTDPKFRFKQFHAPTSANPYMPASEIAQLEEDNDPLVFLQEYLAEFVDWSGAAFFSIDKMMVDGQPVDIDWRVDQIFATIDTASKEGTEHDGTGVIIWAKSKYDGHPLVVLDWDVVQIKASVLIEWLPGIERQLEDYARNLRAREGSLGCWIEDMSSGIQLLQSAEAAGMQTHAIDSKLTAAGKEGRAIAASPYVYQGKVKISRAAFDKVLTYRGMTKNHFLDQVCGFRMGQKKRDHLKDLLDCWTYGVCVALGNSEGY
jgi:phage terminase large subunit-like protein